ncbi:AP-3 complex subunit delta [Tulasnella sp. 427]|nr:AP-3 complex subunit delta [Tulasnella sp. 427]
MSQVSVTAQEPLNDEYEGLTAVHALVSKITSALNTSLHSHTQTLQLLAIQRTTPNLPFPLIAPGRTLIKRGTLLKVDREQRLREFLLLSDSLIWLSKASEREWEWTSSPTMEDRDVWVQAIRSAKASLLMTLNITQGDSTLTSSSSNTHLRRTLQALPHIPDSSPRAKSNGKRAQKQERRRIVEHFIPPPWVPDAKAESCMRIVRRSCTFLPFPTSLRIGPLQDKRRPATTVLFHAESHANIALPATCTDPAVSLWRAETRTIVLHIRKSGPIPPANNSSATFFFYSGVGYRQTFGLQRRAGLIWGKSVYAVRDSFYAHNSRDVTTEDLPEDLIAEMHHGGNQPTGHGAVDSDSGLPKRNRRIAFAPSSEAVHRAPVTIFPQKDDAKRFSLVLTGKGTVGRGAGLDIGEGEGSLSAPSMEQTSSAPTLMSEPSPASSRSRRTVFDGLERGIAAGRLQRLLGRDGKSRKGSKAAVDLVRGLRSDAAKKNEAKFIAEVIDEIRKEITSKDMDIKGGAVCKLTYLDMLGYDMSWASFHVVEVMSSPHLHLKTGGYLAAAQSFDENTDVLMLTTNLLKKASRSRPALNCLAHILTPELARDLALDIVPMLNHSRPLIRKRAILVLYKMMLLDPDALDRGFAKLREKLEDPDIGVISATVNALCELSRREPQRCLVLAPQLFNLLTSSSNNWMLIKIVKLFGALTPHEFRLVRKLQPPLTDLISTTPAISLLYECVRTCIIGGMFQGSSGSSLARTCVQKLAAFLENPDQNLKYIALLALVKIAPSHPHLVAEHQRLILASISDNDMSIRLRALDLLSVMVNRQTLQHVVQHLLSHLSPGSVPGNGLSATQALNHAVSGAATSSLPPNLSTPYRLDVSHRILEMCSRDLYDNVDDFEWYLSVLVDLSYVARVPIGGDIRDQLLDLVARVRSVRPFAVRLMAKLLDEAAPSGDDDGCVEVYWAAAWICGEYCSDLPNPLQTAAKLLSGKACNLPPTILSVYMTSALKLIGHWAYNLAIEWDDAHLTGARQDVDETISQVADFLDNSHIEVQERAATLGQLLRFLKADLASYGHTESSTNDSPLFPKSLKLIHPLSSPFELNAVASEAQGKVRMPEGLDLDIDIVPISVRASPELTGNTQPKKRKKKDPNKQSGLMGSEDAAPPIGSLSGNQKDLSSTQFSGGDDLDSIPIVALDGLVLGLPGSSPSNNRPDRPAVVTQGEMPEDAPHEGHGVLPPVSLSSETVQSPGPVPVVRSKKVGQRA